MSTTQKYIWTALIAFCIGFGLAWVLVSRNVAVEKTTTTKDMDSMVSTSSDDIFSGADDEDKTIISEKFQTDKIMVKDQTAGTSVTIDSVSFEKGGWVAIYEENELGKPGKILGAQLFENGANQTGKVELLRGTIVKGKYFALLLLDNGDRTFDAKKDMPMTDQTGEVIMSAFKAE